MSAAPSEAAASAAGAAPSAELGKGFVGSDGFSVGEETLAKSDGYETEGGDGEYLESARSAGSAASAISVKETIESSMVEEIADLVISCTTSLNLMSMQIEDMGFMALVHVSML